MPAPTTFSTSTASKQQQQPVTVTVEATGVMTGDAAPQISDMPKRCVVDGIHLKKLHHHERHDCEHRISRLNRADSKAFVEAIMPYECLLNDKGQPRVMAAMSAKKEAGEYADAEKAQAKKCSKTVRNFKHKDNRKTWIAGMIPMECPYGRNKAHDDGPDVYLDKKDKKKCKAIIHDMVHAADMQKGWADKFWWLVFIY